jgi:plastocyanin
VIRHLVLGLGLAGLSVPLAIAPVAVATASGGGTTVIGLDAPTPAHHNFGFNDFFPRAGATIHTGDVVDFAWRQNADGLHNVAVLKAGETADQAWAAYPVVVPDPGDAANPLQFNPAVNLGNHPPAGSGAPGACGDQVTPCAYDGSADVIEAANAADGSHHFDVRVTAPAGSVITFLCLVHVGMSGSVKVVADSKPVTSAKQVARMAKHQLRSETSKAFDVEEQASQTQIDHHPDGTKLVTMRAGATAGHVALLEMLPRNVRLHPGDQVRWQYTGGNEIHTVTFPDGTTDGEPLVPACDASPTDSPFVPPAAGPPCGNPALFELHIRPQPFGSMTISDPTTFGSSGLIAAPGGPLPSTTPTFTFPSAGHFVYVCHIHDHMIGTIDVGHAHEHADA